MSSLTLEARERCGIPPHTALGALGSPSRCNAWNPRASLTCGGTTWGWRPWWPRSSVTLQALGTPRCPWGPWLRMLGQLHVLGWLHVQGQLRVWGQLHVRRQLHVPGWPCAHSASTTGRPRACTGATACGTPTAACSARCCAATSVPSAGPHRTGPTRAASAPARTAATLPSTPARCVPGAPGGGRGTPGCSQEMEDPLSPHRYWQRVVCRRCHGGCGTSRPGFIPGWDSREESCQGIRATKGREPGNR